MSKVTKLKTTTASVVQTTMTFADLEALNECPNQRNHAKRAKDAKYLFTFEAPHLEMRAAVLPDGTMYLVDGHTRVMAAQLGLAAHLKGMTFLVNVYAVNSVAEVERLYKMFNSKKSAKTSPDDVYSGMNRLNYKPKSTWVRDCKFGGAMTDAAKLLLPHLGKRFSDYDKMAQVELFRKEIELVDSIGIRNDRFNMGITTAMFLSIRKHGNNALRFWQGYNGTLGKTDHKARNSIAMLHDYVKDQRIKKLTGGGGVNENHMNQALTYYMRDYRAPDKMFQREPNQSDILTAQEFLSL